MSVPKVFLDPKLVLYAALAGLIGEMCFEIYAWLISPILFDVTLKPSNLVIAIIAKLTGTKISHTLAFPLHFIIGSLGFGIFVLLVQISMPGRVWMAGFVSGFILWFVAQGMLAPFIGRDFMMGFGSYTQSSFVGHVGMTMIMAHLLAAFTVRFTPVLPTQQT